MANLRRRVTAAVFVLSIAAAILAQSFQWTIVPSPNSGAENYLYGITSVSSSDAWAVGSIYNSTVNTQLTLTEHWDGTSWKIIPSPSPGTESNCGQGYRGSSLAGVAAVSSSDVWAVGQMCGDENRTLTEHWDGTRWSVVPSPNEDGDTVSALVAVSAIAPNDVWAVGNYLINTKYTWETLIEHWDGASWSIVPSPNPVNSQIHFLNSVSAVSASDVWAVGYSEDPKVGAYQVPLIEHYDGTKWAIVPSPHPAPSNYNALYGVAALAADDVWAVGYANLNPQGQYGTGLIEHWDGAQWTITPSPVLGIAAVFNAVSAISKTDAWLAGYVTTRRFQFEPVVERWNGTAWTTVNSPRAGQVSQLYSLAARDGEMWAVGAYSTQRMTQGFMPNPLTLTMRH